MKAIFHSQLGYCPVIWMFHNNTLNNEINSLHEPVLKTVYRDKSSNLTKLL